MFINHQTGPYKFVFKGFEGVSSLLRKSRALNNVLIEKPIEHVTNDEALPRPNTSSKTRKSLEKFKNITENLFHSHESPHISGRHQRFPFLHYAFKFWKKYVSLATLQNV